MTFSIVGRCADTGQLGIAISSSSIAVGARCPWLPRRESPGKKKRTAGQAWSGVPNATFLDPSIWH